MSYQIRSESEKQNMLSKLSLRPLFPTSRDSKFFVGRKKVIDVIKSSVQSRLNLLILGSRGSGKTSLLNYSYYQLHKENRVLPVLVNILPKNPTATHNFLNLMIGECENELWNKEHSEKLRDNVARIFRSADPLERFQNLMSMLKDEGFQVIFLIDGFDHRADLCYPIMGSLREIFWATDCPYIMTGDINKKNEYLKPPLDAFFDKVVNIEPLSVDECTTLFHLRLGQHIFNRNTAQMLIDNSGSSISDSILLVKDFLENRTELRTQISNSSKKPMKSKLVINKNYIDTITSQVDKFEKVFQDLSPTEKEIVRYLRINGPSSASDDKFQNYLGVTRSRLAQLLLGLSNQNILNKSKDAKKRKILYVVDESIRRILHE